MTRNLWIFLFAVIVESAANAAPVNEAQAKTAVQTFLAARYPAKQAPLAPLAKQPVGPRQSRLAIKGVEAFKANDVAVGYVVRLNPSGYVLMRADSDAPPIKFYSDNGSFDALPPGFLKVIELELREELANLEQLRQEHKPIDAQYSRAWQALGNPAAEPQLLQAAFAPAEGKVLLTTSWDQSDPYNYYCPSASFGPGGRALVGCIATALAQILRYHAKPDHVMADYTYEDAWGACTGIHSISDAGMQPYSWADMPASVDTSSPLVEKQAVGRLMYHLAVAVNMDFEAAESVASGGMVSSALRTRFGYASGSPENLPTNAERYTRIASDIDANLPVYYEMNAKGVGGHAAVCDGYRNGNEIHLNFGWAGAGNAWYSLDNINPSLTYTSTGAVFGIRPLEVLLGAVQFKSDTLSVDEGIGTARIYVTRIGGNSGPFSVSYATADDTALAGTDYTAVSGTLTWADGDGADKYIDVPIVDDRVWEETQTFNISLTDATDSSLGWPSTVTVNILNNDRGSHVLNLFNTGVDENGRVLPDGTIGDPHYALVSGPLGPTELCVRTSAGGWPIPEGGYLGDNSTSAWVGPNGSDPLAGPEGTYIYRTTFDLSAVEPPSVRIEGLWSVDDQPNDIRLNGVSIGNGTDCGSVPYSEWMSFSVTTGFLGGVNTLDFVVGNVSGPGSPGGSFSAIRVELSGTAELIPTGVLHFNSETFSSSESDGAVRVYVSRTGGSFGAASVAYATADGTAKAGADYTPVFGILNWANGDAQDKYFDVPIIDDLDAEATETFSVSLSNPTGSVLDIPSVAVVSILDNESPVTHFVDLNSPNPVAPYISPATAAVTIQEAIDVAQPGDTVRVAAGVYVLATPVCVNNSIQLSSVNGSAATIIDGNHFTNCLEVAGPKAVVAGFTIRNGAGGWRTERWANLAGGIDLTGGTLTNCIVTGNGCSPSFSGTSAAGISCFGATVTHCTISGNTAHGGATASVAGGIYVGSGGVLQDSVVIENTTLDSYAGGVWCGGGGLVERCTISNNSADWWGGGVSCGGGEVRNCRIIDNAVMGLRYAGRGGGVELEGGTVQNCLIAGNNSRGGGDAVRVGGSGGGVFIRDGVLRSCTVVSNVCMDIPWEPNPWGIPQPPPGQGGGVFAAGGTVINSIVYFNTATAGANCYSQAPGSGTLSYCCVTPDPGGNGNLTTDPQFVNREAEDFHLLPTSPCVGGGVNEDWMVGATELDGKDRIIDTTVDVGSYEYGTTYSRWAQECFAATDLADPLKETTVWGPAADPDHDGRVNLLEYAFGTDPSSNATDSNDIEVASVGAEPAYLHVRFQRRLDDATLEYVVEVSADLQTWNHGSAFVCEIARSSVPGNSDLESVEFEDLTPVALGQPRFIRVRVVPHSS